MKKLLFVFIILLYQSNAYTKNIVYLDVQYIIDNSKLGKFYKSNVKTIQDKNNLELKKKQDEIKNKEKEINNKKNILNKDEIEKQVIQLNELIKNYQIERKELNKKIIEKKKIYTSEILNLLNPLLTNYVDKNGIILVVEKKNILVGIKSLDITTNILNLLDEETLKNNLINEN